MNDELIKKLKDDPYFIKFQAFMVSKIDELSDIEDLTKLTNQKAGETVRIRGMAITVLKEILQPFVDFSEKREPTAEEVQAAKDKAGL